MSHSSVVPIYESLLKDVHRMVDICEEQQNLLLNGPLEALADTMSEREALVTSMLKSHAKLTTTLKDNPVLGEDDRVAELKRQVEEGIQQYLHLGQIVQHLLTKKGELMVTELLEHFKAVSGISEYRQTDRNTDLVARAFPGNMRYFDEKS